MTALPVLGGIHVQQDFADFSTATFGDLAGYAWHLTGSVKRPLSDARALLATALENSR